MSQADVALLFAFAAGVLSVIGLAVGAVGFAVARQARGEMDANLARARAEMARLRGRVDRVEASADRRVPAAPSGLAPEPDTRTAVAVPNPLPPIETEILDPHAVAEPDVAEPVADAVGSGAFASDEAASHDRTEPDRLAVRPAALVAEQVDPVADDAEPAKPLPTLPPARGRGLEEALGAKVFVWIGGVALALAGAFLVKYSWENQLLPVSVRLVIAAVFGGAMVGVGTWLRGRSERVAAALVGAGVADLYGVTFAASNVYHFLGPVTGFVLLALVTAGAVSLSLRHGRFVALLGLVGGFCTPLLIGDARAADGPLLGYLLVLQIGLVVVTRQRGWIGLSAATLVGSIGWGLVQALTGVDGGDRLAAGVLGLGSAAVFVLNAAWVQAREQSSQENAATRRAPISPFGLAVSALSAAGALLGIVTVRGGYGPQELAMVGLLGAGAIALARLDRRYLPIPWLTLGLSAAMLVGSVWSRGASAAEAGGFARVVMVFAALYAAGGYAASWGARRGLRVSAVSFTSLATVGGAAMLVLGAAFVPASLPRGEVLFGVAAAGYAAMAWVRARRRPHAYAAGPLGLGAWGMLTAAVVSAVTRSADTAWVAPALALVGAGAAWSTRWPGLRHHGRWAVGWCAAPLLLVLLPYSGWVWTQLGGSGGGVAAGRLAACYGLAVAGLVAAVAGLRGRCDHDRALRDLLGVLATALAATGAVMVVAAVFHRFDVPAADLWRVGTLAAALGVVAAAAHVWATRAALPFTRGVSAVPALAAGALAGLGLPWATQALTHGTGLAWIWPALGGAVVGLWALGWQRRGVRGVAAALHTLAWGVLGWGVFAAVRAGFTGTVDPPWVSGGSAFGRVEVAVLTALLAALAPGALALRRAWPAVDPVDALRGGGRAALGVAAAMGVLGLGLLTNPLLAPPGLGGVPVFNAALLAYGLAALTLAVAATAVRRFGADATDSGVERAACGVAAALGVLGVAVLIRHVFHHPDLRLPLALVASGESVSESARIGFREYGAYALALLGAASVGTLAGPRGRRLAGPAAVAGVLVAALGAGGLANPLRFAEAVGAVPVLNAVLWVLMVPAALAGFVAWRLETTRRPLAGTLAGGAVLLAFGGVSLLVRQAFVGPDLTLASQGFGAAEWYAYSAAWLGLGVALLAGGVLSGRASLRYGSLAVLLLAVGKVFLLDTRHLDGLLRAGSFLGLGVTLMALGYVYQRFVFGPRGPAEEPAAEPSEGPAPDGPDHP